MSKDLEELERGILEFEKELEDDCNNEWLKRVIAGMKKCYQRLQSIDNSNPSEALKELEQMREYGNHFWVADKVNKSYITIKEYILKAQELEKELKETETKYFEMCHTSAYFEQENTKLKKKLNKHCLKWEDLDFTREEQMMKVLLNGREHILFYESDEFLDYVAIDGVFINTTNKQIFDNLHLERVE